MSDNTKNEVAALRAEVEALKAAQPKPQPTREERERADAEHRDWVHQMRERQANSWMPPSAVQAMVAAEPRGFMKGVVHDNRAPTGRPGMIPSPTQGAVGAGDRAPANVPGGGTGWQAPVPLGPQPGIFHVDAQCIADDVKQRSKKP